jgi:hypothetical protein
VTDARDEELVVTDSGGTMRLLAGPIVPEMEPDLALLESLRTPYDAPSRPAGTAPYLPEGTVLTWHYSLGVDVLRVVRDDERGLVAWLPAGSERRPAGRQGPARPHPRGARAAGR